VKKKNLIQPVSSSKETVSVEIKNNIAEPVLKKSPAQIQPLKILSNHDWIAFFRELEMSVFVKNYYGNFTFLKMEGSEIYLGGDLKRNDIPLNVKKEFEDICTEAFKTKIIIKLEQSITTDGPLQQEEKENKVKQENAEDNIKNNESIKNFMTKFDATIKEKSIKPIN
jgi:hypothetical protein